MDGHGAPSHGAVRTIFAAQAVRALAYGFGSVTLGVSLQARGWTLTQVGLLLTAILAGTAITSIAVGTFAERIGRRRVYTVLFLGLAASGIAFGLIGSVPVLIAVALTGTISTEVVENGPFTSIEQAMLAGATRGDARAHTFGRYNAVATLAGSGGALLAGGPALLRRVWPGLPPDQRWLLILVPAGLIGAALARSLPAEVEVPGARRAPIERSRRTVGRLSALFATDSFGGGFVTQSFVAFWFAQRFGASAVMLGAVFASIGLLQTASFLIATRLAARIGLLNTMVFTHLPSNLLLASIPLAPNVTVAIVLLLCRHALGQMDVPARQAYVASLVDPHERTAAAAYTNSARALTRPAGPAIMGATGALASGLPFVIAGGVKCIYDVALWLWFRNVPLVPDDA